jgi:hypothetical protein
MPIETTFVPSPKAPVEPSKERKERNNLLIVVCGRRRVGKTTATIKVINKYIKGNPEKGIKQRKVIILDVNDEFTMFKAIDITKILEFTHQKNIEARRVRAYHPDGSPKSLDEISHDLETIMANFRGGMILIEDITKFVGDTPKKDLIGKLCTMAHVDTDIIIHFQGIGKAGNNKILMNLNVIRLHWTEDSVEKHKDKFNEKVEILKIGEAVIRNSVDIGQKAIREIKRAHPDWESKPKLVKQIKAIFDKYCRIYVYVMMDDNQITGNFTEAEFRDAVFRYISENQRETIDVRLRKIDRKGNFLYNKETAIKVTEDELCDQYYGNN